MVNHIEPKNIGSVWKWDKEGLKIKQKGASKSTKQEEQVQALSTSRNKYNPDAVSCKCI